jgi:hypothetical protein
LLLCRAFGHRVRHRPRCDVRPHQPMSNAGTLQSGWCRPQHPTTVPVSRRTIKKQKSRRPRNSRSPHGKKPPTVRATAFPSPTARMRGIAAARPPKRRAHQRPGRRRRASRSEPVSRAVSKAEGRSGRSGCVDKSESLRHIRIMASRHFANAPCARLPKAKAAVAQPRARTQ